MPAPNEEDVKVAQLVRVSIMPARVTAEYRHRCEEVARKNERASVLEKLREALKPGYSDHPASDTEILEYARDLVEEMTNG